MHIVLVCHTELDFEGTWSLYETIQPRIEELFKRVSDISGKAIRTTFCVTLDFLLERLDEAFRLIEQGHEIGIHSHLPGAHRPRHRYDGPYAFRIDENGVVNQ
ncbi:MAG TPA: hypothetical protein HPP77_01735, partial [Candidatus Hydrogenedentes bacterium]|nr:hypothetical protein [Candidatus Hydrogenedentota bacterium]